MNSSVNRTRGNENRNKKKPRLSVTVATFMAAAILITMYGKGFATDHSEGQYQPPLNESADEYDSSINDYDAAISEIIDAADNEEATEEYVPTESVEESGSSEEEIDDEPEPIHPFNQIYAGVHRLDISNSNAGEPIGTTLRIPGLDIEADIIQGNHHENGQSNVELNTASLNTINQESQLLATSSQGISPGSPQGFKISGHNRFDNTTPVFHNLEEWSRDAYGEPIYKYTDYGRFTYTIVERIITTEVGALPFMTDEIGNNTGEPIGEESVLDLIDMANRICDPNCDGSRCTADTNNPDRDLDLNCSVASHLKLQVCRDVNGERRIVLVVAQLTSFTGLDGVTVHVDLEWNPQSLNPSRGFRANSDQQSSSAQGHIIHIPSQMHHFNPRDNRSSA